MSTFKPNSYNPVTHRAEKVCKRFCSIEDTIKSIRGCDLRLRELRDEINYAEQKLYNVEMFILKELKSTSIHLLKLIHENSPDSPVIAQFADLLYEEEKWCKDDSSCEEC